MPPRRAGPSISPLAVVAEILGEPAANIRDPGRKRYRCPFVEDRCSKRSTLLDVPYPVCTLKKPGDGRPICVCPRRLYEADIVEDAIRNCWVGQRPRNLQVASEVRMGKFGQVDLVLADIDADDAQVRAFLPVELQAVDITGSAHPAYTAILDGTPAINKPSYSFNWANVRKRFISQLITKGFFCHHWETRIVAVVQDELFATLDEHARIRAVSLADSNIVFLLYRYAEVGGGLRLQLDRVVPTTHADLMNAAIYERPPNRGRFERAILRRLGG